MYNRHCTAISPVPVPAKCGLVSSIWPAGRCTAPTVGLTGLRRTVSRCRGHSRLLCRTACRNDPARYCGRNSGPAAYRGQTGDSAGPSVGRDPLTHGVASPGDGEVGPLGWTGNDAMTILPDRNLLRWDRRRPNDATTHLKFASKRTEKKLIWRYSLKNRTQRTR